MVFITTRSPDVNNAAQSCFKCSAISAINRTISILRRENIVFTLVLLLVIEFCVNATFICSWHEGGLLVDIRPSLGHVYYEGRNQRKLRPRDDTCIGVNKCAYDAANRRLVEMAPGIASIITASAFDGLRHYKMWYPFRPVFRN